MDWNAAREERHETTVVPTFDEFVGIAMQDVTDETLWWPNMSEAEKEHMYGVFLDGGDPEAGLASVMLNRE